MKCNRFSSQIEIFYLKINALPVFKLHRIFYFPLDFLLEADLFAVVLEGESLLRLDKLDADRERREDLADFFL